MAEESFIVVTGSDRLLLNALPVEPGRVASRRILKAPGTRIVRLALDAGQALTEHTAAVPVLVQVLSGTVIVEVTGESTELDAGGIIYISARVPHSVEARGEAQLTLTLLDGFEAVHLGEAGGQRHDQEAAPTKAPAVPPARSAHSAASAHSVPQASPAADAGARSHANNVVLASSGADAVAVESFTRRHAELSGSLATRSAHVLEAAASGDAQAMARAWGRLDNWARTVLVAQLTVEADLLFPVADDAGEGELVGELRGLLERIDTLLDEFAAQTDPAESAASAVALRVTVDRLLRTERERLLPLLAGSSRHSLTAVWSEVERTGASPVDADADHVRAAAAACECGVLDDDALPELDVRTVPHAIRHATVFGALDAIGPGGGLVLIASHDPLPLLAQIEQRTPNRFGVSYLERGPEDWRLQFVHRSATVA